MANYYTEFSFEILDLTEDERAWLERYIPLHAIYCEHRDRSGFYNWALDSRGLQVWSDFGESDPELAADMAQAFLAKWRPDKMIAFEWANTCSKQCVGGGSGGAVVVTATEQHWMNTATWILEMLDKLETPENIREYVRISGVCCLYCGSEDIEGAEFTHEGGHLHQEVKCNSCHRMWVDEYTLTGAEPLE